MSDSPRDGTRGRADLHIHTVASDGTAGVAEILEHVERATDLDVIAITDHERIDAAVAAQRIALARGMTTQIVVGEEVTTRNGHLIGLFMTERIKPWGSMKDAVARIHDQGGIVSVPHPFSRNRLYHLKTGALERVWQSIDCIEVFNAREALMSDNRRAAAFAKERGIAGAVGSDAHRPSEIGRAWIEVDEFAGRDDFVAALRGGTVHGRLTGQAIHLATRYDVFRKWLTRRTTGKSA